MKTTLSLLRKIILLFVVPAILILPGNFALAENITQEQLEQELKEIQQQIDQYSNELAKTQSQKNTLANKINQLKVRQNSLNLQIKQTSLQINQISDQLGVIEADIGDNLQKQQALKYEMIRFLRQMNMEDESILLQLLSANGFTGACDEIKEYRDLARELGSVFKQNKILSIDLLAKQDRLEDQKTEAGKLLEISSMQKAGLTESLGEQNSLLTKTKGVESNYQAILSDSKKRATEIRNRIYDLFNTGKQIDFGQAVDIAKWASGLTGVRPALLLAILTQESNLGKNVGTCNRAGDPEEKSWKVIMKPTRDQEPFEKITKELGLNIDTTAVSCPMRDKNGKQVGWGGAMGPAQFIPSTWMGYKDKVSALSGKSAANPWDIRDAFLASAVKLKSDGANGTDDGDWKAALRYFAGSVNLTFRFYADNVLATAKKYQADIDEL